MRKEHIRISFIRLFFSVLSASAIALTAFISASAQPIPNRPEISITPLTVNSSSDDFASQFVYHGHMLFFTSARSGPTGGKGDQRIWYTQRQGTNTWGEPTATGDALSYADHVGSATVTPDGNFMIFAAYKWESESRTLEGEGRTDLYSAERRGGVWTNVQNLGPVINSIHWESQPSLSSDGAYLYFASDRPGGQGGTDIYVSRRSATGWTTPRNVGTTINTVANEMSPMISPDGSRLFFSSNGHGGVGGFDIFVTDGGNPFDDTWGSIENLGTPINTAANEHFFISEPNSKNGYFSSDKDGDYNIYLAYPNPYPPSAQVVVQGRILDDRTRQPIEATVTVTDLESGEVVSNFRSDDQTGEYTVILGRGKRYAITADAPGYIFYSDDYTVPEDLEEGEEVSKDILLREGSTRLLIYFDYNKWDLKKESFPDLERAVAFLQRNTDLKVEIAGHTDSVGTDAYNESLSQRRAESVRQYMINKGVAPGMLTAKGYGEQEPVADNGTDEGRALNRRVEMRVWKP